MRPFGPLTRRWSPRSGPPGDEQDGDAADRADARRQAARLSLPLLLSVDEHLREIQTCDDTDPAVAGELEEVVERLEQLIHHTLQRTLDDEA